MMVSPLPDEHPAFEAVVGLLERPAKMSGFRAYGPEDVLWIAYADGVIWGAASTRGLDTGDAEIIHISGKRVREWLAPLDSAICDWALTNGAPRIVSQGRRGWQRIAAPLGWRLRKSLDGVAYYEKEL